MNEDNMVVGKRVELDDLNHPEGEICEEQQPFGIGTIPFPKRVKVRWDDPELGISGWLTASVLIEI